MKKNIAIVACGLYGGGSERIAGLLSMYLSQSYKVCIFITDNSEITYEYKGELVLLPSAKEGISRVQILRNFKEKYYIDCSISFTEYCNFLNIQSKGKEIVIISVRTTLSIREMSRRKVANIKWLYHKADHITAVSRGVEYDLVHNYNLPLDKITTIYNFVDKDRIVSKSEQDADENIEAFKNGSKLLLHIARLNKVKNQKKLLTQFSLLAKKENVKLLMIGSGPEESFVHKQIRKLGLIEKVRLLPYQSNPFCYYKFADAFVLTSVVEGMPNVLLEAMLLKIPVVSVDCMSGPRELVAQDKDYSKTIDGYQICENGILVDNTVTDETGETSFLCQAMQRILTDENLKESLVKNASKFIEGYTNESILNQWISVIENTVSKDYDLKDRIIPALRNRNEVIVYGAGKIGSEVMLHLLEQRKDWDFICFAVTDKSTGISPIKGIGLYELNELYEHRDRAIVVISVAEKYEEEVLNHVIKHGFQYTWGDV